MMPDAGAVVKGQLVRFRDGDYRYEELDREEGFNGFGSTDSWFYRTLIDVETEDGSRQRAWAYLLADAPGPEVQQIPSGDWKAHRAQSTSSSK